MDDTQAAASDVIEVVDNTSSISYARFVRHFLAALFLFSVVAFSIVSAAVRKQWDVPIFTTVGVVGGLFSSIAASRTWSEIAAAKTQDSLPGEVQRRTVLGTAAVIGILSLTLAAISGMLIGQNGAEAVQLQGDVTRWQELDKKISQARGSAQETVPDQIRMYKAIEPDLVNLKSTLSRLDGGFRKYDTGHGSEHEVTQKALTNIGRSIRQANLIQAEMAVAKKLEALDHDSQLALWRTEMDPLLQQEDALK